VTGVSARRLVARALAGDVVNVDALVKARRAFGSWRALARALDRERLAPLVGHVLASRESPVAEEFKAYALTRAREVLASNLVWRRLFERVRDRLAAAGIPAIAIKGVDLAFAAYPSPACRPMTDVDILVSPEDFEEAAAIIEREGMAPIPEGRPWWPSRTFSRAGEIVDLHWSPAAAIPPRKEQASRLFTGEAEEMRDELRLLVSVCHHRNHFFTLSLLDFYETLLLAERVSWPRYWGLARRWSSVRATRFALMLARSFFEGRAGAGGFGTLAFLSGPSLAGASAGRGARVVAYALSLDNPAAALGWSFRKPGWLKKILTGRSLVKPLFRTSRTVNFR
jgi:hypothetical protein